MPECKQCGDPDYYFSPFSGDDCPNPTCVLPGKKRTSGSGTQTATITGDKVTGFTYLEDEFPGMTFEGWYSSAAERDGVKMKAFITTDGNRVNGQWLSEGTRSATDMATATSYNDVKSVGEVIAYME